MLPYINAPFQALGGAIGSSGDELKLIFTFLLSYPLAALLKRIPDARPDLKNAFIVAVSTFYLVGLFDLWSGVAVLLFDSIAAYLIAHYIHGPYMPWIGFVVLMGHLSVSHLYRHFVDDPGAIDITGAQMVLVMKLTAFCWNVHDGRLPEKDLEEYQKDHAVQEMPSLLNYAGYVSFFPSLFAGPAFDYVDYRRWLETTMFALPPGTDPSKAPATRKKRKIPKSGTPALVKAVMGIAWIIAFVKFSGWYTVQTVVGDEFLKYSLLRRIWYLYVLGFATRTKYYGVWNLTEGSCILAGIGYNGIDAKTGRADWSRLQNVNALGVELAQNTRAYLGNWNMNTNNWLRNCVYLRVTPKGKKPGFRASLATFVTSAFWHGFEPGYYLTFVLAAFLQTIAKNCRRYIRPFFLHSDAKTPLPSKRYYDVLSWFITQTAFAYTVAPFILLNWGKCFTAWSRVYFYCIIGVAASFALFSAPGKSFFKTRLARRDRGSGANATASTESLGDKGAAGVSTALDGTSAAQRRTNTTTTSNDADHITAEAAITRALGDTSPSWFTASNLKTVGHDRSGDSSHEVGGHLGLPEDPQADFDELLEEVKREVSMRRERGMSMGGGLEDSVRKRLRELMAGEAEKSKRGAEQVSSPGTVIKEKFKG